MDVSVAIDNINYLAVLLAVVAGMVWGAIWYSRSMFGNKWSEITGIDMDSESYKSQLSGILTGQFVMLIIQVFVLALVLHPVAGVIDGAFEGAVLGLGFGFTTSAVSYMWQMRSKSLVWIDGLYSITSLAIMGAIIGWIG